MMIELMKDQTLFENIMRYIDRQSMTVHEFSKRVNISIPTIYLMQSRKPALRTYHKLASELNVDVWDLRQLSIHKDIEKESDE